LEKKVLRAIQINISENPDNPNHVVESYTFTFSYQSSLEGTETLAGVTMQDPNGANTTVKNVKYALQMFVRKIIALCETLPELPGILKMLGRGK
jgi:meiosis-specific protein HOP1